jgi:hypothetical protein
MMPQAITELRVYQQALDQFHTAVKDSLESLMAQTGGQGALNEEMMIAPVKEIARIISENNQDGPFTRDDLVLILNAEWNRIADRYEQGLRGDAVFQREVPANGERYATRCPFCGFTNCLQIVQAVQRPHQEGILRENAPQAADGFACSTNVQDDRKQTTEREEGRVECNVCDHQFDVSLLTPHLT